MQTFLRSWGLLILAGISILLGVIMNLTDNFNFLILAGFVMLAVQIVIRNKEMEDIKNAKPNMKVEKAYEDDRDVIVTTFKQGSDITGFSTETGTHSAYWHTAGTALPGRYTSSDDRKVEKCRFAHVVFMNEPTDAFRYAIAEKVWAEIIFYDKNKKMLWDNIKGRWGETGQPTQGSPIRIKRELLEVDFAPNGLSWELGVAVRNVNDKVGYVFNNDSYEFTAFKRGDMVLRDNKYYIRIILRGVRLEKNGVEFCFELYNGEDIRSFKIVQIDSIGDENDKQTS